MNKLGPKGYHAYTQWFVRYNYTRELQNGRCGVTEVKTSMTGDVLMPRWSNRRGASPDLVARWERYETALRAHEEGHLDTGRELADVLVGELKNVPPRSDCGALDAAVRARFDELLRTYQEKDKDYDRTTGHGRTQGATF